jgi:hypothetical protein
VVEHNGKPLWYEHQRAYTRCSDNSSGEKEPNVAQPDLERVSTLDNALHRQLEIVVRNVQARHTFLRYTSRSRAIHLKKRTACFLPARTRTERTPAHTPVGHQKGPRSADATTTAMILQKDNKITERNIPHTKRDVQRLIYAVRFGDCLQACWC